MDWEETAMDWEETATNAGILAGFLAIVFWFIFWFAIWSPPNGQHHHYPNVEALVTKVGPASTEEGETTRPAVLSIKYKGRILTTMAKEMPWTTGVGEHARVVLGPKGPWVLDSQEGERNPNDPSPTEEREEPRQVLCALLIPWLIFGFLVGALVALLIVFWGEVVWPWISESWSLRSIKRILVGSTSKVIAWLLVPFYALNRRRSKSYRHIKSFQRELKRMSPTPSVVKAREQVQALILKLHERENSRSNSRAQVIGSTVETLRHEIELDERARRNAHKELGL